MASPDWRPSASLAVLRERAAIVDRVRTFFKDRGLLEVETPALSVAAVTDPNISSFELPWNGPDPGKRYLHTSPEFPMKRLLAGGSGDIWQIARVFRDGEAGRRHNPEFSLLEWYRVGWDHHRLMDEVEDLLRLVMPELDDVHRLTYADAFLRCDAPDPHGTEPEQWHAFIRRVGIDVPDVERLDAAQCRDLVLTHRVEPRLPRACFLHAYPADQAALARVSPARADTPALAERFELYIDGVELANGFHELADSTEQRARFESENRSRVKQGMPPVVWDDSLLAALDHGLPDCAGVALGIDRLVMTALGLRALSEVMAFPVDRA
ncbi:MAG: EF-P lysine aminoacylase EpmA [Gammaproteobacteria bacterium]